MRNRISCTAQTLAQLEPEMVRSVVGGQVFGIGNQYFEDNRVSILEADSMRILSEVSGTFGVYSQTIKLQSGTLQTKCSCPSNEQPFCRHCVAVLLRHHHDHVTKRKEAFEVARRERSETKGNGSWASSTDDFNFRDVTSFIDWIQDAIPALCNGRHLPVAPAIGQGGVGQWVESIETLHKRLLRSEEERKAAEDDLAISEERIRELTLDLEQTKRQVVATQGAFEELQKEIEHHQALFAGLAGFCQEEHQLLEQINSVKVDLRKKDEELEALSQVLQKLFKSLQVCLPSHPSAHASGKQ